MYPVIYKHGPIEIRSFGVMMVLAFFAALWLVRKRAPQYGLTAGRVSDVSFWALLAGIIGARIVFIAQEWDHYSKHLNELLTLRFEGLTSFGGLFFGAAVVALWAYRYRIPFRNLADLFAPGFLIGHVIGRIGCLLNGCCFGGVCPPDMPWGIHVEGSPVLHHPAQAYDSLMNLAALGLILAFEKRPHRRGQVAGLFFVLHGLTRFIYEFWRAGSDAQVARGDASSTYWGTLPITQAQGMAIGLILIGAVMFAVFARKPVIQQELQAA